MRILSKRTMRRVFFTTLVFLTQAPSFPALAGECQGCGSALSADRADIHKKELHEHELLEHPQPEALGGSPFDPRHH